MISDKTIEEATAKYWCAFADKELRAALDKVTKAIASHSSQDAVRDAIAPQAEAMSESAWSNVKSAFKGMSRVPTAGGPGMVFQVSNADPQLMQSQANHALAAAAATAALLPGARDVTLGTAKAAAKNPGTALLAGAAGKLALDAAGDEGDSWLQKLEKLVNKVWDIGAFTAKHGKALAIAGTTAYALFKTADIWLPVVGSLVKSLLRGNSLATLDFDSNGRWHRMRYDVRAKRWELTYKGLSFGATPPPEEVEQLMSTKFFSKFLRQCKKYVESVVGNDNRAAVVEAIAALSDKQTRDALSKIFSDEAVLNNMFALKFKY